MHSQGGPRRHVEPNRIARLRRGANDMGLDQNEWFGSVELLATKKIGQETVTCKWTTLQESKPSAQLLESACRPHRDGQGISSALAQCPKMLPFRRMLCLPSKAPALLSSNHSRTHAIRMIFQRVSDPNPPPNEFLLPTSVNLPATAGPFIAFPLVRAHSSRFKVRRTESWPHHRCCPSPYTWQPAGTGTEGVSD
jgi:hypothetical protein